MATHNIMLDLNQDVSWQKNVITITQGETGSEVINATIMDSGEVAILEGLTPRFCFKSADGQVQDYTMTALNGNTLTYTLHQAVGARATDGIAWFEFTRGEDFVEATSRFAIHVNQGVGDGIDPEYFSILDTLVSKYTHIGDEWAAQVEKQQADFEASQEQRDLEQAKNNADQARNNQLIAEREPYTCANGEYDPDTLQPTIEGVSGRLYLVPTDLSDDDRYMEWLYTGDRWEKVGSTAGGEIATITTDQIDAVIESDSSDGAGLLSLPGLGYFWKRIKAWAAATFRKATDEISQSDLDSNLQEKISAWDSASSALKPFLLLNETVTIAPSQSHQFNIAGYTFISWMGYTPDGCRNSPMAHRAGIVGAFYDANGKSYKFTVDANGLFANNSDSNLVIRGLIGWK